MKQITLGKTIHIPFTTHAAAGGVIAPSDAFEANDIVIYKDGNPAQKASSAGITIDSPFDARVGHHYAHLDTSDNTDIGFWASGSVYDVYLIPDTETIDGKSAIGLIDRFELVSHKEKLEDHFNSKIKATCVATNSSATQAELPAGTYGDLEGSKFKVIAGAGIGQSTTIESFDDGTDIAVFTDTLSVALNGTSVVLIEKDGRSIISAANPLDANVVSVNGITAAAVQMAISAQLMLSGTAVAGTLTTTQSTTNLTQTNPDKYKDAAIIWASGALIGQRRRITGSSGTTTVTLTFDAFNGVPAANDQFLIV